MKNKKLQGIVNRITHATSENYSPKERLQCLKESFDSLSEMNVLSQEEISEIIDNIQPKLFDKWKNDDQ